MDTVQRKKHCRMKKEHIRSSFSKQAENKKNPNLKIEVF